MRCGMCVRWMVAILVLALIGCGDGDKAHEDNAPTHVSQRKAETNQSNDLGLVDKKLVLDNSSKERIDALKQIALSLRIYEDRWGVFPPRQTPENSDKDRKPHLSWRVHILPMLHEANNSEFKIPEGKKIHWNQPWDSPENLWLLDHMPAVLQGNATEPGHTTMLMVIGKGTFYEGRHGLPLRYFGDGLANTIMFVEAGADKAVPWTKPNDLPFVADDPMSVCGDVSSGFRVAFANGSARLLDAEIPAATLKALLTRFGGDAPGDF